MSFVSFRKPEGKSAVEGEGTVVEMDGGVSEDGRGEGKVDRGFVGVIVRFEKENEV